MKIGKADLTLSGFNAFDQDYAFFIRLSRSYTAIRKRNLIVDIFKRGSLRIDQRKTNLSFIDHYRRWLITSATASVATGRTAATSGHYGYHSIGTPLCFKHAAVATSRATAATGRLTDQYGRAAQDDRAAMGCKIAHSCCRLAADQYAGASQRDGIRSSGTGTDIALYGCRHASDQDRRNARASYRPAHMRLYTVYHRAYMHIS